MSPQYDFQKDESFPDSNPKESDERRLAGARQSGFGLPKNPFVTCLLMVFGTLFCLGLSVLLWGWLLSTGGLP